MNEFTPCRALELEILVHLAQLKELLTKEKCIIHLSYVKSIIIYKKREEREKKKDIMNINFKIQIKFKKKNKKYIPSNIKFIFQTKYNKGLLRFEENVNFEI